VYEDDDDFVKRESGQKRQQGRTKCWKERLKKWKASSRSTRPASISRSSWVFQRVLFILHLYDSNDTFEPNNKSVLHTLSLT
jgi:hypothetical protein